MSAVPFNGQTIALVEISPDGKGHMPVVRLLGDDPSTSPTAPTGLTDAELRASPVPMTIAGAARTPSMITETSAGTVAAGALSVSFANIGTASATVAGGAPPKGYSVTFDAPKGDTLAAIAYTASATAPLLNSKIT
jgi:hypothetical protein